jgi:hypothetical protein
MRRLRRYSSNLPWLREGGGFGNQRGLRAQGRDDGFGFRPPYQSPQFRPQARVRSPPQGPQPPPRRPLNQIPNQAVNQQAPTQQGHLNQNVPGQNQQQGRKQGQVKQKEPQVQTDQPPEAVVVDPRYRALMCYNCGEPGHFVGICKKPKVCFICSIPSHYNVLNGTNLNQLHHTWEVLVVGLAFTMLICLIVRTLDG